MFCKTLRGLHGINFIDFIPQAFYALMLRFSKIMLYCISLVPVIYVTISWYRRLSRWAYLKSRSQCKDSVCHQCTELDLYQCYAACSQNLSLQLTKIHFVIFFFSFAHQTKNKALLAQSVYHVYFKRGRCLMRIFKVESNPIPLCLHRLELISMASLNNGLHLSHLRHIGGHIIPHLLVCKREYNY